MNLPILNRWIADRGDATYRMDYPLTENSIVFDAGGYRGDFAQAMFDRYNCTVHCFEPIKRFYADLCLRFIENQKIHLHPFALAAENKSFLMKVERDKSRFSNDGELVTGRRLILLMEELGVKHIDLLKLNIEGAEYEVLTDMIESGVVERCSDIQVQFHDFVDMFRPKYDKIEKALIKTHYQTYHYPFVWENWRKR